MLMKFIDSCIKNRIFNQDSYSKIGIVVAVSGGADSLALLDLLDRSRRRFKLELCVAHYEHGLRGEESKLDAEFVKQFAEFKNLNCVIESANVKSFAEENKLSIETAARQLRYEFFEKLRQQLKFDYIATAHHADDQAETILMRLIRGSGSLGISAMNFKSGKILRPLLNFKKSELETYCQQRNLIARIDSTNFETDATRNKIRLELLPKLKEYNPLIVDTLCRFGEIFSSESDFIIEKTSEVYHSAIKENKLSQTIVNSQHVAIQRALIRKFVEVSTGSTKDFEFIHYESIRRVMNENLKGVELPHKLRANLNKGWLTIEKNKITERGLIKMKNTADYIERVLFKEEDIAKRVAEMGEQISNDYKDIDTPLLTVAVLNGAAVFFADLVRKITIPVQFDNMIASSYDASSHTSGKVNILKNLENNVKGRHILLIEDIIDSGTTMNYMIDYFKNKKANDVKVCALLNKPSRRKVDVKIDYCGFDIEDEFIVGYGLDFAQHYRNLPYLGVLRHSIYEKK